MKQLLKPGRIIFAIGFFALGILCFIFKDFIVGRPPAWPSDFNGNPTLGYISGALLIVAAIAILINKKAGLDNIFGPDIRIEGNRFVKSLLTVNTNDIADA